MLMTAVIAVWLAFAKNYQDNAMLAEQIEVMRPFSHELIVEDPDQIAIVHNDVRWRDEYGWKVYLPRGTYRLCLATREIGKDGQSPIIASAPIEAGARDVVVKQSKTPDGLWLLSVCVDNDQVMEATEPKEWCTELGWHSGPDYRVSSQLPANETAVIVRRRFSEWERSWVTTPDGPCNGYLLWIEPHH